jgi:tetratricopeptide (TPR) repeat protein
MNGNAGLMATRSDRGSGHPCNPIDPVTPSSPSGAVAYSHLEIEATAPGKPLVILCTDGDRRTRRAYEALRLPDCNRVLLRPAGKGWFHDGVPGLGTTIEEAATSLRRMIEALHPSQVVTFGASTGGYAAIVFGSLLQADLIVALSPELQLMQPGSRSAKDLTEPPRKFGDLLPHLQDRKPGSVWLVASEAEIIELHGAVRAAALPAVHAVALRNTPHLCTALLGDGESCLPVLEAAVAEEQMPPIADAGDLLNDRKAVDAAYEAHTLLIEKNAAEAERYATQAAERRPDWPLAQHLRGRALSLLGRDTEAEVAAGQAAVLDPMQAPFQYHHGLALARLGRFAEAAVAQRAAIEHGHVGPWAHHHLGVALQRSGDFAGAEAAHRTATERSPKAPLFQHHLAIALTALERLAEAELAARKAVSLNVENVDYLRQLARILRAQGRKDEAAEMLKEVEALDPTDEPPAHVAADEPPAPAKKKQPEPSIELPASVAEILARVPGPDAENADFLRQLADVTRAQERKDEPDAEPPTEAPAAAAAEEPPAPADEAPKPDPMIDLPPSVAAILARVPKR